MRLAAGPGKTGAVVASPLLSVAAGFLPEAQLGFRKRQSFLSKVTVPRIVFLFWFQVARQR